MEISGSSDVHDCRVADSRNEVRMSTIIAALICLSPLLFMAAGFYLGRYGSPIVIAFRGRRRAATNDTDTDTETEIYTA